VAPCVFTSYTNKHKIMIIKQDHVHTDIPVTNTHVQTLHVCWCAGHPIKPTHDILKIPSSGGWVKDRQLHFLVCTNYEHLQQHITKAQDMTVWSTPGVSQCIAPLSHSVPVSHCNQNGICVHAPCIVLRQLLLYCTVLSAGFAYTHSLTRCT